MGWYSVPAPNTNFKLFEGTIASTPADFTLDVLDGDGEDPAFSNDEFNDKYVIVSDITKNANTEQVKRDNGGTDILGVESYVLNFSEVPIGGNDYTRVESDSPGDSDDWELVVYNADNQMCYGLINCQVEDFTIDKDYTINKIVIKTQFKVQGYADGSSDWEDKYHYVSLLIGKENDGTLYQIASIPVLLESPASDESYYKEITVNVGSNWAKYFNKGVDWYEDLWIGFSYYERDDNSHSAIWIDWKYCDLEIFYDTLTFDSINVPITDTVATDQITSATNFNTLGVAENDSIAIGETMDQAFLNVLTSVTPLPKVPILFINNGVSISKGISSEYFAISGYGLFISLCGKNTFTYFKNYDSGNLLYALKEEDITLDGGTISGFKPIKSLETLNNKYGYIEVWWSGLSAGENPAILTTGADNPKSYPEVRKDILTFAEAMEVATDLAIKYADFQRSIPLTWDSWIDLKIGYLYDFTIFGVLYENQICRRISIKFSNGHYEITGYFGGGHTPDDEWIGEEFGKLGKKLQKETTLSLTTGFIPVNRWSQISGIPSTFPPTAHKTSHEFGGSDALSLDHVNLANIGTNAHTVIDTHIADSTKHFTEGSIDHTAIQNIGTNAHSVIDSFIASKGQANGLASLDSLGVLSDSQIPGYLLSGMQYIDDWDASAGTYPAITSRVAGDFYICTTSGTINGILYSIGDKLVFDALEYGWDHVKDIDDNYFGYLVDAAKLNAGRARIKNLEIRGKMPFEVAHTTPVPYDLSETRVDDPFSVSPSTTIVINDGIDGFDQVANITGGGLVCTTEQTGNIMIVDAWVKMSAISDGSKLVYMGFLDDDGTPNHVRVVAGCWDTYLTNWMIDVKMTGISDPLSNYNSGVAGTDWIHIAFEMNDTTKIAKVYINKSLIFTSSALTGWEAGAEILCQFSGSAGSLYMTGLGSNYLDPDYVQLSSYVDPTDWTFQMGSDPFDDYVEDLIEAYNYLLDIVEDTTPALGGDLDTNGFNIDVSAGEYIGLEEGAYATKGCRLSGYSSDNSLNIQTTDGTVYIGCRNSSWGHIETSGSNGFYFYQGITFASGMDILPAVDSNADIGDATHYWDKAFLDNIYCENGAYLYIRENSGQQRMRIADTNGNSSRHYNDGIFYFRNVNDNGYSDVYGDFKDQATPPPIATLEDLKLIDFTKTVDKNDGLGSIHLDKSQFPDGIKQVNIKTKDKLKDDTDWRVMDEINLASRKKFKEKDWDQEFDEEKVWWDPDKFERKFDYGTNVGAAIAQNMLWNQLLLNKIEALENEIQELKNK